MTERALPSGTVTFLFTDIEGSTRRWEQHPGAMGAALARHNDILRQVLESNGGHVFKTVGDAFYAAFADAGEALDAAVAAQLALQAEPWSQVADGFEPLRVRIAIHTGLAEEHDGDYVGEPLNRVARLEAAACGGQILLTLATQQLVRARLEPGWTLRDWGVHRLKDLQNSEHIYQLVIPGLADVSHAPDTVATLEPRDRIIVAESGGEADDAALLVALLASARGDDTEVRMTPAQARTLAARRPADLTEYRLGRIAEWSQPRYRLDGRFVHLTLIVDRGDVAPKDRWQAQDERYGELSAVLRDVGEPAIVVLGPPGSGKSTLMRHLELELAIDGLRDSDEHGAVTFLCPLGQYKPLHPGDAPPTPGEWLAGRWRARFPALRSLEALLSEGRMLLLLDGLNEMPAGADPEYRDRLQLWKDWLQGLVAEMPGNRAVFSCRTLEYSRPLSTPDLPVPQVRIEPLTDDQIREFLALYQPLDWRVTWAQLRGTSQLEVLRSPYFLRLLADQIGAQAGLAAGKAALFSGFVRQSLKREMERDQPGFRPGELLTQADCRQLAQWRWQTPYTLPDRGTLISGLSAMAHAMQKAKTGAEPSQVRIGQAAALQMLGGERGREALQAAAAIAVIEQDPASDEIMFAHHLMQEYFAARCLASRPEPSRVAVEWRADRIARAVGTVIDGLAPADPLPGLHATGWEETTTLAAAMAPEPQAFVARLVGPNLALAGRIAAQPDVRGRLDSEFLRSLRLALVARSRDATADLRDRIACGLALGTLGDPRFEDSSGPGGQYIVPPMVEIPAGAYPIGEDEAYAWKTEQWSDHCPRHHVPVSAFSIGRFPVTNAEWACFIAAGGYDDERWWDTAAGQAWRRGLLGNVWAKTNDRKWRQRFRDDPGLFDKLVAEGRLIDSEVRDRWREWIVLGEEDFERALDARWSMRRATEPDVWRDERFNNPAQPVLAVCWFEARAYCRWLGAQSGLAFRLPTEVEREAATRGQEGRLFAYGDVFDRLRCNAFETHVRRTTPVGVFPDGDTPEGAADLSGNTFDWTSSAWGENPAEPRYRYPYQPGDGREQVDTPPTMGRVLRGGSWAHVATYTRGAARSAMHPDGRGRDYGGVRLAISGAAPVARDPR